MHVFKGGGDGGHGGVTPEGSRHFGAEGSTGGAKGMMDNPVIMFDMILHSHNTYILYITYMIYIYIHIIYIYIHMYYICTYIIFFLYHKFLVMNLVPS